MVMLVNHKTLSNSLFFAYNEDVKLTRHEVIHKQMAKYFQCILSSFLV